MKINGHIYGVLLEEEQPIMEFKECQCWGTLVVRLQIITQ